PGLKLEPGEHAARARLTTRSTHEEHFSEPVKFRIRPPKNDDKDGGDKSPKQKEKPQPQQPQPKSGDPKKEPPPPKSDGNPPPPPAVLDKKVVVPLFGEGEEVKKHGLVLVLDPGGGIETPPT